MRGQSLPSHHRHRVLSNAREPLPVGLSTRAIVPPSRPTHQLNGSVREGRCGDQKLLVGVARAKGEATLAPLARKWFPAAVPIVPTPNG